MFLGYRFVQNVDEHYYHAAEQILDAKGVWDYVQNNIPNHPLIRVTVESNDSICVEAIEGRITFPKQWSVLELITIYQREPERFNRLDYIQELQARDLQQTLVVVPSNVDEALRSLDKLMRSMCSTELG